MWGHALDIVFLNERVAAEFNSTRALTRRYGDEVAQRIRRRLDDLRAAPNLEAMKSLPGRCHELKHDRVGQLALDLRHPLRLIIAPAHEPVPQKPDGGLDWVEVTIIRVVEVVDYHD